MNKCAVIAVKERIRNVLESFSILPCGPIYENLHKALAELYKEDEDELSCIFHLSEAHGASTRFLALTSIAIRERKAKNILVSSDLNSEFFSFENTFLSSSVMLEHLYRLPSEWTIVQLTPEFDPLSRSLKSVTRNLGLNITRFSCGENMKDAGQGGPPFTVFLHPLDSKENPSIITCMRDIVNSLNGQRKFTSQILQDFSLQIEAIVNELDGWLCHWRCLLPGRLVDQDLWNSLKASCDKLFSSYVCSPENDAAGLANAPKSCVPRNLSDRSRQILYLLASSLENQRNVYRAVLSTVEDTSYAIHLAEGIVKIRTIFNARLKSAQRHPVILILDEGLDMLPFEMISILKGHPVTRMPNIHFISALYEYHKEGVVSHGVDINKGYYIINPSGDLPNVQKMVETDLKKNASSWFGLAGVPPSAEVFQDAIENYDFFLYCGHGGGNQFFPEFSIEKMYGRAVVVLFGCSSSKYMHLGGRVPMYSLFNSYLISGCPCVIGNLWNVTDTDSNRVAKELIGALCSSPPSRAGATKNLNDVDRLTVDINSKLQISPPSRAGATKKRNDNRSTEDINSKLQNSTQASPFDQGSSSRKDLLRAVARSKKCATYYMNEAALVVRGLPLFVVSNHSD